MLSVYLPWLCTEYAWRNTYISPMPIVLLIMAHNSDTFIILYMALGSSESTLSPRQQPVDIVKRCWWVFFKRKAICVNFARELNWAFGWGHERGV